MEEYRYEIWDGASGNLVTVHPTEAEALAWIRHSLVDDGSDFVLDLALLGFDEQGRHIAIAEGEELQRRALTQVPTS